MAEISDEQLAKIKEEVRQQQAIIDYGNQGFIESKSHLKAMVQRGELAPQCLQVIEWCHQAFLSGGAPPPPPAKPLESKEAED